MCFTDLMLHTHLISDRIFAIGIIGDQHSRSHTLGDRLDPLGERLTLFGCQRIDGQGQAADGINGNA